MSGWYRQTHLFLFIYASIIEMFKWLPTGRKEETGWKGLEKQVARLL
jgi:hypothetical protein